jgi:hypothetical protein
MTMSDLDAHEVAKRMLRDPKFRYDVEARLADEMKPRPYRDRLAQLAAPMFDMREENGQVWIWINGLQTYGVGDDFHEARRDALDEIDYALEVLWKERQSELGQEEGGGSSL